MRKKELQVTEPNSIAEAKGRKMSKAFLDTLYITLNLVASEENVHPDNLDYEFCVTDYKEKFGLQFDKNVYKKLRKAIRDTMRNDSLLTIINEQGNEVDFFPFQEIEYDANELKIHIVLGRRFKKIITDLLESKGKKVYFSLTDTLRMKSEYTKKMYPILLEYIGKPMTFTGSGSLQGKRFDRIDTIENFKELLCIPKSYVIKNIKDTCTMIQAEIEAYTPYRVEVYYNQIAGRGRYGGKTTHICWTIRQKEKVKEVKEDIKTEKQKKIPVELPPTEDESWLMGLTNLDRISCSIILRTAEEYGRTKEYITEACEVATNSNANDLGKLLTSFMKKGYSKPKKNNASNNFHNFSQREYDYDELERRLLGRNKPDN